MPAPINTLKAAMADRRDLRGPFLSLGSETTAEIAGRAGFDFVLVDAEHGAFDPVGIRRQLMAIATTGTPAIVRVPSNADWILKQALDLGAETVMVPMINTAKAAEAAVRACCYPPNGIRGLGGTNMRAGGYGATGDYAATANDQIGIILQIESLEGVSNIEAICAVDGVDCVFVGPADLACDMGHINDLAAEALWTVVTDAVTRIAATKCAAGVFAAAHQLPAMRAAGATVFGVGSDAGILTQAMGALSKATS